MEDRFSRSVIAPDPQERRKIVVGNIPYSWYPTVSEDGSVRIIHPGTVGRRLFELSGDEDAARDYLEAVKDIAVTLPNGGLAYYYPRQVKISRLLGPDLAYSGMTAGDVLAGYVAVLRKHREASRWCNAREAYLALAFPWEQGGVNLGNRALLELPLFRSAPEVVLNGWLHALLFMGDYVQESSDGEAHDFMQNNLQFLSRTLSHYDDGACRLSRYSDCSPYRVSLAWDAKKEPDFHVFYKSRLDDLDNVVVRLEFLDNPDGAPSLYDNQLIAPMRRPGFVTATITASQKYDTVLVSKSGPFSVTLDPGRHDWMATTPKPTGKRIKTESTESDGDELHTVNLSSAQLGLMGGCATSFTKFKRQNYYHMQHVVALLYLAETAGCSKEVKDSYISYAEKWFEYAQRQDLPEGLSFAEPEDVMAALHRGKAIQHFDSFATLRKLSGL